MTDRSVLAKEPLVYQPGFHSHNARRVFSPTKPDRKPYRRFRLALVFLGVCCLGFYLYTLADQYVYQNYQNWAFDQEIAGNASVTFADYLRAHAPFSSLPDSERAKIPKSSPLPAPLASHPQEGDVLGRVSVDRLQISAIVREGVSANTLSLAVGHVSSTALPGQLGNFAIAAHRDTLFRGLKYIREGDLVTVRSTTASFTYRVVATKIVKPSDVSVLRSDGGGLIGVSSGKPQRLLTMITCYPFRYVGSAPKRFIVEGILLSGDSPDPLPTPSPLQSTVQASHPASGARERHTQPQKLAGPVSGSSRHLLSPARQRQNAPLRKPQPVRKRKWWLKVFHRS